MSIFGTILRQYCENVQIGFGANIRDKTITWKGKFSSPKDMHSGADNVSLILAITRCINDCVGLIISFSLFHTVKLQRRGLDREVALLICSGSSWWLTDLGHNKDKSCDKSNLHLLDDYEDEITFAKTSFSTKRKVTMIEDDCDSDGDITNNGNDVSSK
ncbi:hypothetical protein ACFE04_024458 [Oxalis oulophora]